MTKRRPAETERCRLRNTQLICETCSTVQQRTWKSIENTTTLSPQASAKTRTRTDMKWHGNNFCWVTRSPESSVNSVLYCPAMSTVIPARNIQNKRRKTAIKWTRQGNTTPKMGFKLVSRLTGGIKEKLPSLRPSWPRGNDGRTTGLLPYHRCRYTGDFAQRHTEWRLNIVLPGCLGRASSCDQTALAGCPSSFTSSVTDTLYPRKKSRNLDGIPPHQNHR